MIRVEAKQKEKILFLIELQYAGLCQAQNVSADVLPSLLMIQTPTFLFPYARQIISDTTSQAGLPPLFLQPVDFAALYRNQQEKAGVAGNA
jgi:preprotein translocase subunit SecB